MVSGNEAAAITGGVAVGTLQTVMVGEFVDKKYPTKKVAMLKGFGTPSALSGIVGGSIATALGLYASKTGKILKGSVAQTGALGYGAAALISGILRGIYPLIPIGAVPPAGRLIRLGNSRALVRTSSLYPSTAPEQIAANSQILTITR